MKPYVEGMMRPEWKQLAPGIFWCKGCGCVKLVKTNRRTRYITPRREKERRRLKKERKS